jgi:hypothetical protein
VAVGALGAGHGCLEPVPSPGGVHGGGVAAALGVVLGAGHGCVGPVPSPGDGLDDGDGVGLGVGFGVGFGTGFLGAGVGFFASS